MRPTHSWTIDASVAIARLLREDRPAWVDTYLDGLEHGRLRVIAPDLLWLEIGNRLSRLGTTGDEFAVEAMLHAERLGIEEVHVDRPVRLRALTLARLHRLTMYDATYLAVAETHHAPLLTLDRQLELAARSMGLGRTGGHDRVSEPAADYALRPADPTSLAAIGRAIAEMRREFSA